MFGRVIWDKLPECTFENVEIAWVKRRQFQNLQNREADLSLKSLEPNMWLLVNHTKPTNAMLIVIDCMIRRIDLLLVPRNQQKTGFFIISEETGVN